MEPTAELSEQELANITLQFLSRAQLQGQEVPAFSRVMHWLETKTRTD